MTRLNSYPVPRVLLACLIVLVACRSGAAVTPEGGSAGAAPAATSTTRAAARPTGADGGATETPAVQSRAASTVTATASPAAQPTREVIRQWGASAEASSAFGEPGWSAMQAVGEPDTPGCGDVSTAWASAERTGLDWIEIYFATPVLPLQVNIVETYAPNQVTEVELLDSAGNYHSVYTGEPAVVDCPYTLAVDVTQADYLAVGVRLTVDQTILDPTSWNEIDAVELVGRPAADEARAAATSAPAAEASPAGDYMLPAMSPDSLAAGTFYYAVAGAGEDATIDSGTLQDQSTTEEYVIGFVSQSFRHAVTLFLPHGLVPGLLALQPYDDTAFAKGPSAAIYIGAGYYYADGGQVQIDAAGDGTVTGRFVFAATYEFDPARVVTVSGTFREIPLVDK